MHIHTRFTILYLIFQICNICSFFHSRIGCTDKRTNGQTDGWIDRQRDGQTGSQTDGHWYINNSYPLRMASQGGLPKGGDLYVTIYSLITIRLLLSEASLLLPAFAAKHCITNMQCLVRITSIITKS